MKLLPDSPVRLGRIALACAALPLLGVAVLFGSSFPSAWGTFPEVSFFVGGPLAVLFGMIAVCRWQRNRRAMPRPWCAFVATLIGYLVLFFLMVALAWPSC